MARKFYRYPPRPSSGAGTFADNIVGLQIVTGGGLTQGNFDLEIPITEKVNREFNIGSFSDPISLDTLNIQSILESKSLVSKEFRVYPNFDLSEITKFTLFGPLTKRFEAAIQKIIHFFPGALEISSLRSNATTGITATNAYYENLLNITTFFIDVTWIDNPFGLDYSVFATRNISLLDYEVSPLRNLTEQYSKYSLFINDVEYPITYLESTSSLYSGILEISVIGDPFNGNSTSTDYLVIRPNSYYSDKSLLEPFDEVEKFLLNRLITPKYTANFQIPKQTEDGLNYISYESVTWPLDGVWNLDIRTIAFDNYLTALSNIADIFDATRTNLVSRFLTTDSFKEFDTGDQKIQKVMTIYGRSFDNVKKFVDALSFMNSVNYTIQNDIPSQLLQNLANTLGWNLCTPGITSQEFLNSVFGMGESSQYPGYSRGNTPDELNFQFYRNLILNSAYLFKSKGTRRAIEYLLRLLGAPDALIDFNESIYVSGQRINMSQFESQYSTISGGTYVQNLPVYTNTVYSIQGVQYTAFTSQRLAQDANSTIDDYPIDSEGYPSTVENTDDFYFHKGSGWFSLNGEHQTSQEAKTTNNGQGIQVQTQFDQFDYGQKYLDRYRKFPYMSLGFKLNKVTDNKKSWASVNNSVRVGNNNINSSAHYFIGDDKQAINVKNTEVYLNPSKGLLHDVWYLSTQYDYPLPASGMSVPYPSPDGVLFNVVNVNPTKRSFFEFAQNFWQETINVRNRQTDTRGSIDSYPSLQQIWCDYLNSEQAIGVENNNFNYQNMIDFVNSLGTCWTNLIEQLMPATSLVSSGVKLENAIFHRQKFVYRVQRCCQIVPIPCDPCSIYGNIFPNVCVEETITCHIYPWYNPESTVNSFEDVLYQSLILYLDSLGLELTDCCDTTLISEWYVIIKLDNILITEAYFYKGYGLNDVPTKESWLFFVKDNLLYDLVDYGISFTFGGTDEDPTIELTYLGCEPRMRGKTFSLDIGFNFDIECTGGTTTTLPPCMCYIVTNNYTPSQNIPVVTNTTTNVCYRYQYIIDIDTAKIIYIDCEGKTITQTIFGPSYGNFCVLQGNTPQIIKYNQASNVSIFAIPVQCYVTTTTTYFNSIGEIIFTDCSNNQINAVLPSGDSISICSIYEPTIVYGRDFLTISMGGPCDSNGNCIPWVCCVTTTTILITPTPTPTSQNPQQFKTHSVTYCPNPCVPSPACANNGILGWQCLCGGGTAIDLYTNPSFNNITDPGAVIYSNQPLIPSNLANTFVLINDGVSNKIYVISNGILQTTPFCTIGQCCQ